MSLDVSLVLDKPIKKRGTGVFIREGGKTIELSPDEVLDKWPDSTVQYKQYETAKVFSANITHNLTEMAAAADLYDALWRPDEHGFERAKDIIHVLANGLIKLRLEPEHFKRLNPENGWGDYDGLLEFATNYLVACEQYPAAKIEVDR